MDKIHQSLDEIKQQKRTLSDSEKLFVAISLNRLNDLYKRYANTQVSLLWKISLRIFACLVIFLGFFIFLVGVTSLLQWLGMFRNVSGQESSGEWWEPLVVFLAACLFFGSGIGAWLKSGDSSKEQIKLIKSKKTYKEIEESILDQG